MILLVLDLGCIPDLSGADLRGANLHGANLTIAIYTPQTRWPDGFDPIKQDASPAE